MTANHVELGLVELGGVLPERRVAALSHVVDDPGRDTDDLGVDAA